jgi:hypothetical protein
MSRLAPTVQMFFAERLAKRRQPIRGRVPKVPGRLLTVKAI